MAEDVLIRIRGSQLPAAEPDEAVEVVTGGKYYYKEGTHYICYEEVQEDSEVTRSLIKADENCVEVTRRGFANTHMIFQKEKKNETRYETPFGSLNLGIAATDIDLQDHERGLDLRVSYVLDINSQYLADCEISVQIISRSPSSEAQCGCAHP